MEVKKFYANEPDDLHCLQSSVRMVYETLMGKNMSLSEAETFTGFVSGQQTWPFEMMLSFANLGFNVKNIEIIDNELFARDPREAVVAEFGEEMWEHIKKVSDIERAQKSAHECVLHESVNMERKIPSVSDLEEQIKTDRLAICNVNYKALAGLPGYNGHFVVVEKIDENGNVALQNPGLPPIENQEVSSDRFKQAWYFPNERAGNIISIG